MMRTKTWLALGLCLGLATVALGASPDCDQKRSLRKECLEAMSPTLPAPVFPEAAPGTGVLLPRSYAGAPPQIPHSILEMPVDLETNTCLACHLVGGEGMPGVPPSHRQVPKVVIDPKAKSGQITQIKGFSEVKVGEINSTRYVCLSCHVPQAENLKPLVPNLF